jgi:pyridoxamine 5'-phosphate oxidase
VTDDIDLVHMRKSYQRTELHEDHVCADPIEQLQRWLEEAIRADVPEPNAMCLSTCIQGQPSSRMVLLRRLDASGLVFYTSYFSRKGRELDGNPRAALLFYWPQLERQVRVEGTVQRVGEDESDAYFASRPRGHQLGAWASEQSEPVENRELLDQRMHDYEARFEGEGVPRPHSWGGYTVSPQRVEFWQGRPNRMHDRLEFTRTNGAWSLRRLQP